MSKAKFNYLSGIVLCYFIFSNLICLPETYAFDYVMGKAYYNKPNIPKPNKGQTIIDPNFHTSITRISDRDTNGYYPSSKAMGNQYSMPEFENSDGTLFLGWGQNGRFWIYNHSTSQMVKSLPLLYGVTSGGGPYVRWSRTHPRIIYYLEVVWKQFQISGHGPKLWKYNIDTDALTVVHDFAKDFPSIDWSSAWGTQNWSNVYAIVGEDYMEPDTSGRYWAFIIKRWTSSTTCETVGVFTYDMVADEVLGSKWAVEGEVYSQCKSFGGMSPLGNYVAVKSGTYTMTFWDRTFTKKYLVTTSLGHGDWGVTKQGHEAYIFGHEHDQHFVALRPDTADLYAFIPFECASGSCVGYHVSAHNGAKTPGWALISTYSPKGTWMDNQLFMLEIDETKYAYKKNCTTNQPNCSSGVVQKQGPGGARVWRLAWTRSTDEGSYWAQAFATINNLGTRVYWGASWDVPTKSGGTGWEELYKLDLPSTWYQDLTNTVPPDTSTDDSPPAAPKGVTIIK